MAESTLEPSCGKKNTAANDVVEVHATALN